MRKVLAFVCLVLLFTGCRNPFMERIIQRGQGAKTEKPSEPENEPEKPVIYYTVTFDSKGGTPAPSAQDVGAGGLASKPGDPAKNGFAFGGWYKDEALISMWDFASDTVTADITLYAKWNTIPPEQLSDSLRWSKWVATNATATLDLSVGDDNVATITVGGVAEPNNEDDGHYRYKTNAAYSYTAAANTSYIYEFEAWTKAESGDRVLNFQYYWDDDDEIFMLTELEITEERKTYTISGQEIPKGGIRQAEFQCADQLGTFYVRMISITKYEDTGTAAISITVEQITEGAPLPDNANGITISRSGSSTSNPPNTFTITVSSPSDYGSIQWEIAGSGSIYAGSPITGTGASFTLNATDVKYNSLGGHTLKLTVTKDGIPYMRNINFTIVE